MKIICNTVALTDACNNVQRAVAAKSVNPALEGICIKTTEQGIELCGYDLEVAITTMLDAGKAGEGGIILNAKTFCDMLRRLPAENVTIETDDKQRCTIKSGDTEYHITGMAQDEYPDLPYVMGGSPVVLPQAVLKNMIRQVIFAVSTDESKTVHQGVKFEIAPGHLSLIALDGYRLAIRREEVEYSGEEMTFVVPAKTLSEVIKIMDDEDGYLSLNLDGKHIVFGLNGYQIVSRLLEGHFLDYGSAIPKQFETEVKVSTRDFIESIDRMTPLINEKFKTPLRCVFADQSLNLYSNTTLGSASDRIDAVITGPDVEKGFNSRYLSEAFRAIDSDEALIRLNTQAVSPACVFPISGDSFFYMILPVRLPNENG